MQTIGSFFLCQKLYNNSSSPYGRISGVRRGITMRKRSSMKRSLCMALVLCFLLSGCTASFQDAEITQAEFDSYTESVFREEIVLNTIDLHYTLAYPEEYGITDYEVCLGDFSENESEEIREELKEMEKELKSYDPDKLTQEQRLTRALLLDYVKVQLPALDMELYAEPFSPLSGYQAQLPIVLAEYTFRTPQDIEDYLTLLSQIEDVFLGAIEFERKKADAGLFMADFAVDDVIEQCEAFIQDPEQNYMIEVFNDKIDAFEGLSEKEKEACKEKNYELVTTEVIESYQMLIDSLSELKGSGKNELGLCYLKDGREYYEYLVTSQTGTDASVPQLQMRTEIFLKNRMEDMQKLIAGNDALYYEMLDYEFPYTEPHEILEDLEEKIEKDFPQPPETDYTFKYVHPSMQEHLSPAFYMIPPIDDLENNVIYINEKYHNQDIYTMLAHEGYPGHLYQTVYTGSVPCSNVRQLLFYPGYTEGWATYAEMYSYRISGLDKELAELLACNNAYLLGIYAYIDMGIHYDGWDRTDVEDYLAGIGVSDKEVSEEVFDAITEEPADYLKYFIGYLEFLNLRNTARKELGADFELKEFHRFVLETGPAPFYLLEEQMELWIEKQ